MKGILFYIFLILINAKTNGMKTDQIRDQLMSTSLLNSKNDDILLASTLDGTLYALDMSTGDTLWQHDNEPAVKNPKDYSQPTAARFFPNPSDGSLYRYALKNPDHPLKKLPFTIPQLVDNSPCRSSDGIYYLGKKVDSYMLVNKVTGAKELVMDMDSIQETCSTSTKSEAPLTVYLGRTMYNVILYEHHTGNKWNVTYYDYATHNAHNETSYSYVHYIAAGEGSIVTMNKENKKFLWSVQFDSPIISLYTVSDIGYMVSVPKTVVASSTLRRYLDLIFAKGSFLLSDDIDCPIQQLSASIFVGESSLGSTYAIPSLVDSSVPTIQRNPLLLLEGPKSEPELNNMYSFHDDTNSVPSRQNKDPKFGTAVHSRKKKKVPQNSDKCLNKNIFDSLLTDCPNENTNKKVTDVVLLGYYSIPDELRDIIYPMKPSSLPLGITHVANATTTISQNETKPAASTTVEEPLDVETQTPAHVPSAFDNTMMYYNIILVMIVIAVVYICYLLMSIKNALSSQTRQSHNSNGMIGSSGGEITAIPENLPDGCIKVGKITYDPNVKIGDGSNGTFVFRGYFDQRMTAVKRVLPNMYSIALREVRLLQASDQHVNVVRYFCTEQCREFRYICLELCDVTLAQYVTCKVSDCPPTTKFDKMIMSQASQGLAHLHKLSIVHRDIKPSNVLLLLPNSTESLRVRISDFGLCKQLDTGHASFTKHSGVTGTDGWMAPEMIALESQDTEKPTKAVDIFSLGLVFYYVCSGGKHVYGREMYRQHNILKDKRNVEGISDKCFLNLFEAMLLRDPGRRPPAHTLEHHPYLWSDDKVLRFLATTSDIVDKCDNSGEMAAQLTQDADCCAQSWFTKLDHLVSVDLRRHRDYRDNSVKDLLRALRNKLSHYHEMGDDVKDLLGAPPTDFLHYWTSRFPDLLYCTWKALHIYRTESYFHQYYPYTYEFLQVVRAVPASDTGLSRPNLATRTGGTMSKSFKNYNDRRKKPKQPSDIERAFNSALGDWRLPPQASYPAQEEPNDNVPWIPNVRRRNNNSNSSARQNDLPTCVIPAPQNRTIDAPNHLYTPPNRRRELSSSSSPQIEPNNAVPPGDVSLSPVHTDYNVQASDRNSSSVSTADPSVESVKSNGLALVNEELGSDDYERTSGRYLGAQDRIDNSSSNQIIAGASSLAILHEEPEAMQDQSGSRERHFEDDVSSNSIIETSEGANGVQIDDVVAADAESSGVMPSAITDASNSSDCANQVPEYQGPITSSFNLAEAESNANVPAAAELRQRRKKRSKK